MEPGQDLLVCGGAITELPGSFSDEAVQFLATVAAEWEATDATPRESDKALHFRALASRVPYLPWRHLTQD